MGISDLSIQNIKKVIKENWERRRKEKQERKELLKEELRQRQEVIKKVRGEVSDIKLKKFEEHYKEGLTKKAEAEAKIQAQQLVTTKSKLNKIGNVLSAPSVFLGKVAPKPSKELQEKLNKQIQQAVNFGKKNKSKNNDDWIWKL